LIVNVILGSPTIATNSNFSLPDNVQCQQDTNNALNSQGFFGKSMKFVVPISHFNKEKINLSSSFVPVYLMLHFIDNNSTDVMTINVIIVIGYAHFTLEHFAVLCQRMALATKIYYPQLFPTIQKN
jgi:hypothetical protein